MSDDSGGTGIACVLEASDCASTCGLCEEASSVVATERFFVGDAVVDVGVQTLAAGFGRECEDQGHRKPAEANGAAAKTTEAEAADRVRAVEKAAMKEAEEARVTAQQAAVVALAATVEQARLAAAGDQGSLVAVCAKFADDDTPAVREMLAAVAAQDKQQVSPSRVELRRTAVLVKANNEAKKKKKDAALGCARHVSPCGWETWSA